MRIDGLTVCVGPMYAAQLRRSLPVWVDTLDTLSIVTKPRDADVLALAGPSNLRIYTTDVFTRYGAHFNKGAALNELYAAADPSAWVLHVDSDIVPPADWRVAVERRAEPGCLWGVPRFDERGRRMDRQLYPWGYWHLWHSDDPATWRWPLFEHFHAHAGNYDANFADQWPRERRRDLGFQVVHQGERQTNWFGPEDRDKRRMRALRSKGLGRVRTPEGAEPLPLPAPRCRVVLDGDPAWCRESLRACRAVSQFDIRAIVGSDAPDGWQRVTPATHPHTLQELVQGLCSTS